jgi:hypothetical protein
MGALENADLERTGALAPDGNDTHHHPSHTRPLWRQLLAATIALALILYYTPIRIWGFHDCRQYSIVEKVLSDTPLIDGHDDFPIALRFLYQNHIYGSNFSNETTLQGQVDFPRLRQGRLGAQFWSVYVPW